MNVHYNLHKQKILINKHNKYIFYIRIHNEILSS
uniref:Uncharacterized protein n=1 Tax=viral metagenome TaxID=1070528 RepID=A0A6C0E0H2_9ZZZZ